MAGCLEETVQEPEKVQELIPNVEIFKEVVVELLKSREIDIPALKKERMDFIQENSSDFELHEMLLQLLDAQEAVGKRQIQKLRVQRIEDGSVVQFENVKDEEGNIKTIRCSNILFEAL